jgi:acyl-coenzyme A thioesterase PaaI-like protein
MVLRTAALRFHLRSTPSKLSQPLRQQLRRSPQWQSIRYIQVQTITVPNQPKEPTSLPLPRPIPQPNKLARRGLFALAIAIAFSTGWMLSQNPTVVTAIAISTQPSDEKTLEMWNPDPNTPTGQVEAKLQQLPLVKILNAEVKEGGAAKWQASRPHLKIPPRLREGSFTGGHLLQEDKLTVPPLVYVDGQGKELVCIVYLGTKVCGHPGMVHGGLLATLMDEGLARTCFAALPNKVGVTANLNIDYRAPCTAGQFVVLKGTTTKVEGRKAWVTGRIETLTPDGSPGKVLVEGSALFIEPRGYASKLMRITQ